MCHGRVVASQDGLASTARNLGLRQRAAVSRRRRAAKDGRGRLTHGRGMGGTPRRGARVLPSRRGPAVGHPARPTDRAQKGSRGRGGQGPLRDRQQRKHKPTHRFLGDQACGPNRYCRTDDRQRRAEGRSNHGRLRPRRGSRFAPLDCRVGLQEHVPQHHDWTQHLLHHAGGPRAPRATYRRGRASHRTDGREVLGRRASNRFGALPASRSDGTT